MVSQGESPYSIIDRGYFVSEMMTSSCNQCGETRKPLLHCKKLAQRIKAYTIRKKGSEVYKYEHPL